MNADMEQFTIARMLEVMELGQSLPLEDSVSLLSDAVDRWCQPKGPLDDVTILGIEMQQ